MEGFYQTASNILDICTDMARRPGLALLVSSVAGCAAPSTHLPGANTDYQDWNVIECATWKGLDGDTMQCNDMHIRVLGIDSPEPPNPKRCTEGQPFGEESAAYGRYILSQAKEVRVIASPERSYRRILGHVEVDGISYAVRMLEEGLAYETISTFGDSNAAGHAARIKHAAKKGKKPKFEKPQNFRRRRMSHRKTPGCTPKP
jgi:endonuclease YncB( thermonuclease family)